MEEKVATLLVYDSFQLESKNIFIIYGDLEIESDREVTSGMNIHISFNSSFSISEKIHAVEYLRKDGREYSAICLKYEDSEELEMIKALNISEETCEIYSA